MTTFSLTRAHFEETAVAVRAHLPAMPRVGLVLGSGLGALAEALDQPITIETARLPHWPASTVEGHAGRLVFGTLEGQAVLVQQGRAHGYEGHPLARATLPIRVMQLLGVEIVILTNAAGAVNPQFRPGEVMLITDHLNFPGLVGLSPLQGPNDPTLGPRFPDMSQAYDRALMALARAVAQEAGLTLREGVYAGLGGPTFETPAELRLLRTLGADAVGMSTVAEVVVARHGGLRVLGLSGLSNAANLDGNTPTSHDEVLAAGKELTPKMMQLIRGVLRRL